MRFKKSSNLGVWSTLEAPGGRTVQIRKLIIEILIVKNTISDNFHFDQNTLIKSKISVRLVISLNFSHLENFADSRLKILISMVSSVHINFFHKEVFIEFFLAQRMVQAKKN